MVDPFVIKRVFYAQVNQKILSVYLTRCCQLYSVTGLLLDHFCGKKGLMSAHLNRNWFNFCLINTLGRQLYLVCTTGNVCIPEGFKVYQYHPDG